MKITELLTEGGWASTITQNTKITPTVVSQVVTILKEFESSFNTFLARQNIQPIEIGNPAGSTTYYKRDLKINPSREYGDVDVNLFVPKIVDLSNNANVSLYSNKIKEFCDASQAFSTSNGTNVIIKLSDKDYVQVDFIIAFTENKAWSNVLAPEYNVKGVLCNSLYSSLAEALNISMGSGHGVQVKLQNGVPVNFKIQKDVELKTISTNPRTWAVDIARFFGCTKILPLLKEYAGMKDEIRIADIINSIKGIAKTLELNNKQNATELLSKIANIYANKIQKAIDSSKYDKAATPMAIEKAKKTKEMLAKKLSEILPAIKE